MTERVPTPLTPSALDATGLDLGEATRLTRAGRLAEATALIQRGLGQGAGIGAGFGQAVTPASAIGRAGTRPESPRNTGGDAHAALLPEGLRDLVGQLMRGIRGPAGRTEGGPRTPEEGEGRFVTGSFSNAAGARDYKLFLPAAGVARGTARPLLVMLHGCTQSPDDFAAGTQMNALAGEEGWFVVYPRQSRRANLQKCWNWFQPGDQGREHGEAGLIAGLTRALIAEHPIDPRRVYIAGLSAGGAAAANIARAYPDLFAAVGVHSGLAAGCARDLSSALMAMQAGAPGAVQAAGLDLGAGRETSPVPTIVFHGGSDETVNPRNAEEVLAQAGVAGLTPTREAGQVPDGHRYTRTRYADAAGRVQVEAWRIEGAGHAWSGGSPQGSYTDPRGPDASRALLAFFKEHTLGALRR